MSMGLQDGGSTLLQRARAEAEAVVRGAPDGAQIGAVAYADEPARLTPTLTADRDRVLGQLRSIDAANGRSNLRGALLEARRLLGGEAGEVYVFTDEAGPEMIPGAMEEIARLVEGGSAVIPVPVHARPERNVAVVAAAYGEGAEGGAVRVRVANYGPEPLEVACEVTLPDGKGIPVFVNLPGRGEAEERVTIPPEAEGGVGRAWCEDPDLPADDARYFHLPRVGASRVLVVDGDPGDSPIKSEVYFLERALAPWGGLRGGVRPDVTTPMGLSEVDPEVYRVVFIANVADPRPYGPRLTEFVRKGGNVVIGMGDNVTAERYDAALGAILPALIRKSRDLADSGEEGVPLELPDVAHPLFTPFARGGRAGFARVRARRVMTVEAAPNATDVETLLRWEGGAPALMSRTIGDGQVLLWTGTFDLGWSNLPLQAVFMPLMQRMASTLGGAAGGTEGRFDAWVGESVVIPLPDLAIEPDVIGPDGELVRRSIEGSTLRFVPSQPGAYLLRVESAPPLAWVAVNTPPEESDVVRRDSIAKVEQEIAPERFRRRIDLAPWLYAAGMGAMVAQALLAVRRAIP
jgi:hypothetical protein